MYRIHLVKQSIKKALSILLDRVILTNTLDKRTPQTRLPKTFINTIIPKGACSYVGLLKKIDKKQTVKNIKNFFLDDYKRLCVLAGGGITAPKIDGMPKATPADNATENKFINASEYRKLLDTVATAVNACSVLNRTILLARYIEHKPNWKIAQSLGYEKSRYYELYDQACLEFADKLEHQTILLNNPDLVEDLHEYE